MTPFDQDLRFEIYRHFARTTQAPLLDELTEVMEVEEKEVADGLNRLAEAQAIALTPKTSTIWMAHPFSGVPTVYPVHTARGRFWANCAWDAFGIPVVLGLDDSRTPTLCAGTGEAVELGIEHGDLRTRDGFVHFAVRPRDFWENIGHT